MSSDYSNEENSQCPKKVLVSHSDIVIFRKMLNKFNNKLSDLQNESEYIQKCKFIYFYHVFNT